MEKNIYVKLEVNQERDSVFFDYEDVGVTTEKEWKKLGYEEQKRRLQEAVDNLSEQPFWVVDKF